MIVLLLLAAFYNGLTVTEYTLYSDEINESVKIVLLSDLHSHTHGELQKTLIDRIHKQNPDLILMSGDIMDSDLPDGGAIALLEDIAHKYPCFYVTGNHEFWSGRVSEQKEIFRTYGVTVLEGDCTKILIGGQNLTIIGVDDPDAGQIIFNRQLEDISELIQPDEFTIFLSHRPELFEQYAEYDFDLVLSGHAHGGQWRVPLILSNGLLAPDQGLFPKYTRGVHESNGTQMIVSRGLSKHTLMIPRIFNAPELVVIDLLPALTA